MKNYPLLYTYFNNYTVWKKAYLNELNTIVFSTFQYSEYWIPPYRKNDGVALEPKIIEGQTYQVFDASRLRLHEYFQFPEDAYIVYNSTDIETPANYVAIPGSTYVISNWRAEGQKDIHPNTTSTAESFFLQPMGWSAYYTFYFHANNNVPTMVFTYDKYAAETYGNSYYGSFSTFNTRYFIYNLAHTLVNGTTQALVLPAANRITGTNIQKYIMDKQQLMWSNTVNPPMSFAFYGETDGSYGEEIIIDTHYEVSTFDSSNIPRYTIISNEGSHWPTSGITIEIV